MTIPKSNEAIVARLKDMEERAESKADEEGRNDYWDRAAAFGTAATAIERLDHHKETSE